MSNIDEFDLIPSDNRQVALPIGRPELYNMYEMSVNNFWKPDEIRFDRDRTDYDIASPALKTAIELVLAWFACADSLIANALTSFMTTIPILEAQMFYRFAASMEDIHALTYAKNIDMMIRDPKKKELIFSAVSNMKIIKKMCDYTSLNVKSKDKAAVILLKQACVEGLWFTSPFAFIDWLSADGKFPGMGKANDLISRDEGLHARFGLVMTKYVKPEFALTESEIRDVIAVSVEIANELIDEMFPKRELVGMNADLMKGHVQSKVNDMMAILGRDMIYQIYKSPFNNMARNVKGIINNFEKTNANYSLGSADDGSVNEDI